MYDACEIYLFNDLVLDDESLKSLRIEKHTNYELISLLQKYSKVIKLNDNGVIIAETPAIREEILGSDPTKIYFAIDRGEYIILPDISTFYGIMANDEVMCLFDNANVCNAKLGMLNRYGINAILEDVIRSKEMAAKINSQKQLQKQYEKLKYYLPKIRH